MINLSKVKMAWAIFIGVLFLELAVDYVLRVMSDDFRYSGIPELIWFSIHIIAAVIATYYLFLGIKSLNSVKSKAIYLSINLVVGFMVYLIITGLYILGLGIDSL